MHSSQVTVVDTTAQSLAFDASVMPRRAPQAKRAAPRQKQKAARGIERVALKAKTAYPKGLFAPRCLPARAMAHIYASVETLNRSIVNGQEAQSHKDARGQTWADLFSSRRIAADHDELWIKRAQGHVFAGYAAVKCNAAGAELGLITIGSEHRGQGLAKELIGAILGVHPVLHLYVGARNVRAQALYQSFTQRGCRVEPTQNKYYDNGELALGLVICAQRTPHAPVIRSYAPCSENHS